MFNPFKSLVVVLYIFLNPLYPFLKRLQAQFSVWHCLPPLIMYHNYLSRSLIFCPIWGNFQAFFNDLWTTAQIYRAKRGSSIELSWPPFSIEQNCTYFSPIHRSNAPPARYISVHVCTICYRWLVIQEDIYSFNLFCS